ncbi:hypothetical protein LWI29_026971 [Acer saccharum]|uniref:Uncharacterized protein n=1 Tax=Acer saccharum TaxID=4024 RepID=A0AA39W428_ACESA|nr:hypothetical protein LWI29_026971 [Acer saccharum]
MVQTLDPHITIAALKTQQWAQILTLSASSSDMEEAVFYMENILSYSFTDTMMLLSMTSLGVIGAMVKLIDLSKTVATFIVQKILLDARAWTHCAGFDHMLVN